MSQYMTYRNTLMSASDLSIGGKEGIAKALHERLLGEINEMVDSVIGQNLTVVE